MNGQFKIPSYIPDEPPIQSIDASSSRTEQPILPLDNAITIFSYILPSVDHEIDTTKLIEKTANIYNIICMQGIFKEQTHLLLLNKFYHKGYKFLMHKSVKNNSNNNSKSKEHLIPIPGLFFTCSFPIIKWEFEHFETPENRDSIIKLPTHASVKGILSVLLDFWGNHLWVFIPQCYDNKKTYPTDEERDLFIQKDIQKCVKIVHSKFWTNEKQPLSTVGQHIDLTYGSYIELFYGRDGALYERQDMTIGAGARNSKDRVRRFKLLALNQTAPIRPVCYGDVVLIQTYRGMYLHIDNGFCCSSSEPKGQRSCISILDPRHFESTATVRNNDQFVLRDHTGRYLAVKNKRTVGDVKHLEDATLFRLDIFAVVPLERDNLDCQVVTTGSKVAFEEVSSDKNHPHYLTVEPCKDSRWHVHCDSLTAGQLEQFEIINPFNLLDVTPVFDMDVVYLKTSTGHFLSIDPKSGWAYGDVKKPDIHSFFTLAKDLRVGSPDQKFKSKKKPKRTNSFSKPFNVRHTVRLDATLLWQTLSSPEKLFEIQEELGRGSFGKVFKAILLNAQYPVAIKEMLNISSQIQYIQNEIEILKMCHHENVVSYFGSVINGDSLWIVMDYMALGSIRDMIDSKDLPGLTEPEIAYVCAYTLRGLNYLHSRGIVHRDVKAANILLSDHAEIKIADFGVSGFFF